MLQSPQVYALQPSDTDSADFQITSAGTLTGAWTTDLAGMQSLAAELRFLWGSGGTSVKAIMQTAMGPDGPAYDIAVVNFGAVARTVVFEMNAGTTALVAPGAAGLDQVAVPEPEGLTCAVLGDRLRMLLIVTGTYVNTVLSARVLPK